MVFLLIGLVLGYCSFEFINPQWHSSQEPSKINVCFTPDENCTSLIIREIDKAQKFILVQAFSFTSRPIAQSLVAAHKRGVDVKVLIDKSQKTHPHSEYNFLRENGVSVKIDNISGIAHNKVIILDGTSVITGSFNFAKAAQNRNAENVVLIRDPKIAKFYMQNWNNRSKY